MAKHLSIAERVIIHALLDAPVPVAIGRLAELAGITQGSVQSVICSIRPSLTELGAVVVCIGKLDAARYRLDASNPDQVRTMAGPPVERLCFMGFVDRYAAILRLIVEAAGRPLALQELADAVYRRSHAQQHVRAANMILEIRATLEKQGSASTILLQGTPKAPVYVWGPRDEGSLAPERPPAEGVTLPPVGGAYHFAAGRLTLDGRPAGRAA